MPPLSRQEIAAQYENYSIYVILSSRGAQPGFHWGIFIPTATPVGNVWHATNKEGGWKLDPKTSNNVPFSMSLVLAYKIGSIERSAWQACSDVFDGIAAEGKPSPNTGEEFTCRIWVKDAMIALHNSGIIELQKDISTMETEMLDLAYDYKDNVEEGVEHARVENSGS